MLSLKNKKNILFYSLIIIFPYVLFALFEVALRIFSLGNDLSLFVPSPHSQYYEINKYIGERYFSKYEQTTPLSEVFLKEKPTNGYRIFILGESSVQGFPYDANLAFSRILKRRLQDIFPHRTIEIINLGLTAISSYTLLDFTDELLRQKPDLVLIYTGHNEYYGALGVASMESGSIPRWLKTLHLKFIHFRTYQFLQRGISSLYGLINPTSQTGIRATLMEKIAGRNLIPYQSTMYKKGLRQFYDNMNMLICKIRDARVPVIISDLVSNVRDSSPFQSLVFESYPQADSVYFHAKQSESNHSYDKAREEYLLAKDLDAIRFRAAEDFNKIISTLADSLGVFHISLKSFFEQYSAHGLVGDNLMTDHLHPNIDGCFLMAECFFNAIREHRLIEHNWDSLQISPLIQYRNQWGYTELDSLIAEIRIKHLKAGWPFQSETTVNTFWSTYKPAGIVDSLAFLCVKYVNMNSTIVHKKLAEYYQTQGDFKRAAREYLAIAYISPLDVSSYYHAADLAYKAHEFTSAIRYLRELPHPDTSFYAQFMLASIYYEQKDMNQALSCINQFQQSNQIKANNLQFQKLKYQIQKESGLSSDAQQTLTAIQRIDPAFARSVEGKSITILIPQRIKPYLERAEALGKSGHISEAITILKEANRIKDIPYTNLLIGKLLFSQKNDEALSYFEKAQGEIKDDPSLYFGLCVLYLEKRNIQKAQSALDNFTRLQGEHHYLSEQLKALFKETVANKK